MDDLFFANLWHKTFVSSRILNGVQILGYPYPGIRFVADNAVELSEQKTMLPCNRRIFESVCAKIDCCGILSQWPDSEINVVQLSA